MQRTAQGAAFAELVAAYHTRVLGWFCRRLGDRVEAEDLTQDVFLRLYRARASYTPRASGFLVQNVARNALRLKAYSNSQMRGVPKKADWASGCRTAASSRLERAELVGWKGKAAVAELAGRQRCRCTSSDDRTTKSGWGAR